MIHRIHVLFVFLLIAGLRLNAQHSAVRYPSGTVSGGAFQEFLDRVNAAIYPDRTAIVDSFMSAVPSFPFVEDTVAHFIFRGAATSVNVPGDANLWDPTALPMTKLSSTDLWYASQTYEPDARLDYKFITNGSNWILDPKNPHTVAGGFGPNSELAMPGYVQPWKIAYRTSIPHGRVDTRNIYSVYRGVTYQLHIYLPPGYDSSGSPYPTAYFQDGSDYLNLGYTVNVLDNSFTPASVRPLIAVFVTPTDRNNEYAGSTRVQYINFFTRELVPHIDSLYNTLRTPRSRAVIGDSYGGNISALISYERPDLFGNCGLHSGAFQPNSYEAFNMIVNGADKHDSIRYCSVWGTYEGSLPQNMRAFRDSLTAKGYPFTWMERHEGHSWGQWRATTDYILANFFPDPANGVHDMRDQPPVEFRLFRNYPNPFNPSTRIEFEVPRMARVVIRVYDLLGSEVARLADGPYSPGTYAVDWNAATRAGGIYFCRMEAMEPGKTATIFGEATKMLLIK